MAEDLQAALAAGQRAVTRSCQFARAIRIAPEIFASRFAICYNK
jgi:hypothetical protein